MKTSKNKISKNKLPKEQSQTIKDKDLNLLSIGNGYEFVSTYENKNLSKKLKSRKIKIKQTKIKKRKNKQVGGSSNCQSLNNEYLLVNGVEIPESNHAPLLKINDNFAKLIQETPLNEEVNHPHVK
jgi:hypothetical protein